MTNEHNPTSSSEVEWDRQNTHPLDGDNGKDNLGTVTGGSLSDGVEIRLSGDISVEDIPAGSYVVIQGDRHRFFGMVSEVKLATSDPHMRQTIGNLSDPFIANVMAGTTAYGSITVRPRLILPEIVGEMETLAPARTVPSHFAQAFKASDRDVSLVFGEEDETHFVVGTPLDMETTVCLDLETFAQRTNGVFGKSGTGKSFLTRLLLIGMIQKTKSVSLIFDMHNEYGWKGQDSERRRDVQGLKSLFPSKVAVFTLDKESSLRRRITYDSEVTLDYDTVEPQDIDLLAQTLGITPLGVEATYSIANRLGRKWLGTFLDAEEDEQIEELARTCQAHPSTLRALQRRLTRLTRMPFLRNYSEDWNRKPGVKAADSVAEILDYLDRGIHVVLEFGKHGRSLDSYILVANILTRRIHERYVQKVEEATGDRNLDVKNLVIVIEEAHRFLNPTVASQTIFGTIAREMRKYNVTLLVIDQRPSAIDQEVISQIGTKVCCLLDDHKDVEAVMTGTSGNRELSSVLAGLETKQQALIFGHAVPIPVAIRVREYGSAASYQSFQEPGPNSTNKFSNDATHSSKDRDELFG